MEFGAVRRQPHTNVYATEDTDTSPTWRLIGAWVWDTTCREEHLVQVAQSSILSTHLIAVAMLSRKDVDVLSALSFEHIGANAAIEALLSIGLERAHDEVKLLAVEERRKTLVECVGLILKGFTGLQVDIAAHYP
ncbi:hypothetical protein ACFO1B_56640 [Dactylosporangium siamense]|nr:hypothetical protein [Dactylosporangium siamense]